MKRLWRWLQRRPLDRVWSQREFFAARVHCYYCTECDTIGERNDRCPRCASTALVHLAWFIRKAGELIRLEAR